MAGLKSNGAMDPRVTPRPFNTINLCEELFREFNYEITHRSTRGTLIYGRNKDWEIHIYCGETDLTVSMIDMVYGDGNFVYDEDIDLVDPNAIDVLENILKSGSEYWGCIRGCFEPKPTWSEASTKANIPNLFIKMGHSLCSGNCSNEIRDKE